MDLKLLSFDDFSGRTGDDFTLSVEDGSEVTLVLDSVERRPESAERIDTVFSLLFRGPLTGFLEQQMHELRHDELGTLPIFLVPVGKDDDGYYYEAVFTRLDR